MSFAWPHFFWGLALPLLLIAWDLRRARAKAATGGQPHIRRAEIGQSGLRIVSDGGGRRTEGGGQKAEAGGRRTDPASQIPDRPSTVHRPRSTVHRLRIWLAVGLALLVTALARPQWGRIDEPVFDQSREIILALDLSRSMLTPDVKPSRLERGKLLVQALLEKLEGERVGLIVFSGTAFLQSPLSSDYEILREFLPALSPDFLPEGGTNYEALLNTAVEAFGASTSADRFLIVLSDGEATDEDWRGGLDQLKKKGVRMIGLGLGTTAGAMIPDGSGGFVKDERGAVVMSKLEPRTLQELAKATNGTYRDASTWLDLAALVRQTVESGRKGEFVDTKSVRLVERFQWPLAFGTWCLLVSLYREFPVRPRPRAIALSAGKNAPGGRVPPSGLTDGSNTPGGRVPPSGLTDGSNAPGGRVPPSGLTGGSNAPGGRVPPAALIVLLLAAASVGLFPPQLPAAEAALTGEPKPQAIPDQSVAGGLPSPVNGAAPEPSPLGRIVSRLSTQDTLSAPDLAEFARETLRWGTRLKETQQKVPPGPVHDAVQAVDELSRRGDKLADWSKLRQELEALLDDQKQEPPPEQQQQQQNQQQDQDQKQSQDQKRQDEKNSDSSQPNPSQSDPKNQPPQDQSSDQKSSAPPKEDQKAEARDAFGDMKKAEPPPPARGDTQRVGGAPQKQQPTPNANPELALPLDKVDQLKNQDAPAELFRAMQADGEQPTAKPGKTW